MNKEEFEKIKNSKEFKELKGIADDVFFDMKRLFLKPKFTIISENIKKQSEIVLNELVNLSQKKEEIKEICELIENSVVFSVNQKELLYQILSNYMYLRVNDNKYNTLKSGLENWLNHSLNDCNNYEIDIEGLEKSSNLAGKKIKDLRLKLREVLFFDKETEDKRLDKIEKYLKDCKHWLEMNKKLEKLPKGTSDQNYTVRIFYMANTWNYILQELQMIENLITNKDKKFVINEINNLSEIVLD
jgi:hypothetical protein